MTVNFNEILSKPAESAERPPVCPNGSYIMGVEKYETGESAQKKTPFIRFHLKPSQPMEDVDAEAFAAFGGTEKLAKVKFTKDFYLTDDALWRLRDFLENVVKVDLTNGRSFNDAIPDCINAQLVGVVLHKLSQDNSTTYAQLDKVIAA